MKKKKEIFIRYFRCPVCHNMMTATKHPGMKTGIGHIKTMYCPFCKEKREFVMTDSDTIKRAR